MILESNVISHKQSKSFYNDKKTEAYLRGLKRQLYINIVRVESMLIVSDLKKETCFAIQLN